jgi:hypothetical protein
MGKINWTQRVKTEEVLEGVKEEGKTPHTIKRRKANSISHISRRNCLVRHVVEGE